MTPTVNKEKFTSPLYLESGRIIEPFEIVYETYGELNSDKSNVILICHALSGSHHAAGRYSGSDNKAGWWDALVGDGKAVDTAKYFVICSNVIGSCFGTTGPMSPCLPSMEPYRFRFPVVTIKDMVKAQKILLAKLGIYEVSTVIGGSMGGMQALTFAVEYPNFAKKIISMAATHATSPWVIALDKVARSALLADKDFNNGYYDANEIKANGLKGLSAARMAGFLGYLSPETFEKKFGRNYAAQDGIYELFGRFEVERYLDYNGDAFTKWFDPLSFLYITKAIDIFDLARGYDSLEDALKKVRGELYLFGFERDLLFFPHEMQKIDEVMAKTGLAELSRYIHIDSDFGHDSFLVETDKISPIVADILEDKI